MGKNIFFFFFFFWKKNQNGWLKRTTFFIWTKNQTKYFLISALMIQNGSNPKNEGTLLYQLGDIWYNRGIFFYLTHFRSLGQIHIKNIFISFLVQMRMRQFALIFTNLFDATLDISFEIHFSDFHLILTWVLFIVNDFTNFLNNYCFNEKKTTSSKNVPLYCVNKVDIMYLTGPIRIVMLISIPIVQLVDSAQKWISCSDSTGR